MTFFQLIIGSLLLPGFGGLYVIIAAKSKEKHRPAPGVGTGKRIDIHV